MLRFNDLLENAGLTAAQCTVMLHTPKERRFAALLGDVFVSDRPVFEAYQSSHSTQGERTLGNRRYVCSFIGTGDRSLLLAGVYSVGPWAYRQSAELVADPAVQRLMRNYGVPEPGNGAGCNWFDLQLTPILEGLVGRLRIAPKLTRTYIRLAETLDAEVVEIARTAQFDRPFDDWRAIQLSAQGIRALGPIAQADLRNWRGVYMILHQPSGQRYVGSAYGQNNLLGRWQEHIAGEHGIAVGLAPHAPEDFVFTVLERVSPDMAPDDVIGLEMSWIRRLHTRDFGLNK